jgi:type II secretory pathway pseudopilin PulG
MRVWAQKSERRERKAPGTGRPAATGPRRQGGFSFVEILVGITVLALASAGIAAGLTQASVMIGRNRQDGGAHKIATSQLDIARRMPYDQVGTVGGNPPGVVPLTQTTTANGLTYRIDTRVDYVDDPAQGQAKTYVNYKRYAVTVTPQSGTSPAVTQSTLIPPPAFGAIANKATAVVSVIDAYSGQPLPGVSVTIDQSTSPAMTELTDANGQVILAGLEPSATSPSDPKYKYRLSASLAGYATHSTTSPAQMQQHLAAQQTWVATIKMFRPVTVQVNLRDRATGAAVTEAAYTSLQDAAGTTETAFGTTGTTTFTQIAGQSIEPGQYSVTVQADCYAPQALPPAEMPTNYPTTTTHTVDVDLDVVPHGYLDVTVKNASGANITTAQVDVHGGDLVPSIRAVDSNAQVRFCLAPTSTSPYLVVATAPGYEASVQTANVNVNGVTSLTITLTSNSSTCGLRLDAGASGKLVRLVDAISGYTYDNHQPTAADGTALFRTLRAGSYMGYVELSRSGDVITWTPTTGKSMTCTAGNPDKKYSVP